MPYLDELLAQQLQAQAQQTAYERTSIGLPPGTPYAAVYPSWETITPQYPSPSPYLLAQAGYRTNELAYACINERAASVSEAPIVVKDGDDDVDNHWLLDLINAPCPGVNQSQFWKICETYMMIAGFAPWEIERNNNGKPIRLWPMRPDWCSFLRGQGQPTRAIRYQPYGLPFSDIPFENVFMPSMFDPLFPLLKPFSPTMVVLDIIQTDDNMTAMVDQFMRNGAFLGGVLTSDQVIPDPEAERIRARWRELHGGAANAGEIAVLGRGAEFKGTGQTFRDMVFPEVDARSEARICMTYRVSPILIAAKVGIGTMTYNNYSEARKAFYERVVTDEWNVMASALERTFGEELGGETVEFDMSNVKALQEDRDKKFTRAIDAYKNKLLTLDEARAEAGFDAVPGGSEFSKPAPVPAFGQPAVLPETTEEPKTAPARTKPADDDDESEDEKELQAAEEKRFRTFAKLRVKEGNAHRIPEFEFKRTDPARAASLVAQYTAPAILEELRRVARG